MPEISVIVPVYQVEEYLTRCLESILSKSFDDYELLLIDDGSTDRSGIICDEYMAKSEKIVVFHKTNGGVSSARNVGLDHAKGRLITFVDSDDVVHPRYLEMMRNQLGNADFAECKMKNISNESDRTISGSFTGYRLNFMTARKRQLLLLRNGGGVCGGLFIKRTIGSLRFNDDIKHAEDSLFLYLYLSSCNRIVQILEPLYCYCHRPDSAIATIDRKGYVDRAYVERFLYNLEVEAFKRESDKESQKTLLFVAIKLFHRYKNLEEWEEFNRFKKLCKRKLLHIIEPSFNYLNFKEKLFLVYEVLLQRNELIKVK